MMKRKRKIQDSDSGFAEQYFCKYCSYTTHNIDELDEHIQIHEDSCSTSSDKEVVVDDFDIINTRGLKTNTREMVEQDNIFRCSLCGFSSVKKKDMSQHFLTHCSEVYRCAQCPYQTKRKTDMPKHLLVHCTKAPMFKCPHCPYQTKRKNDLPKHLLCHRTTDSVPIFRCNYCEYFTKRKGDLAKHELNHEEKGNLKMYHCSECTYGTKRKNDLHKHMLVHCDRQIAGAFKCLKCPYVTNKVNKFSKHVLSNCQVWDGSVNDHFMLENILDSAEREDVHVLLEVDEVDEAEVTEGVEDEECVYKDQGDHAYVTEYSEFIQKKIKIEEIQKNREDNLLQSSVQVNEKDNTVFKINIGEYAVELNSKVPGVLPLINIQRKPLIPRRCAA